MNFRKTKLCSQCAKKTSQLVDCSAHNAKECLRCNYSCHVKWAHQVHQNIRNARGINRVGSNIYYYDPGDKVFYTSVSRNNDPTPYIMHEDLRITVEDALRQIENDPAQKIGYDPREKYDNNVNIILVKFREHCETYYFNFDQIYYDADFSLDEWIKSNIVPENFEQEYDDSEKLYNHAFKVITRYVSLSERDEADDVEHIHFTNGGKYNGI